MSDTLVIAAHPRLEQSRIHRRLLQTLKGLGHRIELRELYRLYPDYLVDVAAEQQALARTRLVVWLHPIHWYGMPPLMKLWLDEVFTFGWAYGPGGTALQGKDLWMVVSTGGTEASYRPEGHNRYAFEAFLPPFEQTAALAGMRFLPPLVLHGAHNVSDAELAAHASQLGELLQSYPAWPELAALDDCPDCVVPASARPLPETA